MNVFKKFFLPLLAILGLGVSSTSQASLTLIIEPIEVDSTPIAFTPIEIIKTYSLLIDAENSYFKIDDNAHRIRIVGDETSVYPTLHSISGDIGLIESYEENEFSITRETKLTSINVHSEVNNIDLSSTAFWNENYSLLYDYSVKDPDYYFGCACSILSGFGGPYMDADFDGKVLELNGGGYFKKDDIDGSFQLDHAFSGADVFISYHIEANIVSSVPLPATFYFFFSGVSGLIAIRFRRKALLA